MRYEKVGIDMGYDSIKMVAFRGENETYGIKAMETYYVDADLLSNEYFNSLKRSIKLFLKDNKIKRAAFCFTVSMNDGITINHLATLPIMKQKFLKKSINFELEDAGISEELNNYYHKWEIIKTDKAENKYDILVLGIKRELVNQISKIANLKYKIDHIELQPATLGRMIEGTKLVLDYGQESTRVFYYKDGNPLLMKSISMGGKDLDGLITKRMGEMSREEIAGVKQQTSIHERDPGENLNALEEEIKESITDLTEEIRRYIRSIELQYEVYFDTIHYTGGLSNLLGLREHIASELSVSFVPLDILNLPGDSRLSASETSLFFFAISAAMYKDSPYLSNLYFTKLAKTQMDYSPLFVTALCAAIVLNLAAMDVNGRYDKKVEELDQLSYAQSNVISLLEEDLEIYQQEIEQHQKYIETINRLSGHNTWLSDILYVLTMETPEEVIVKSLRLQDGNVAITGYAKDYSSIAFITISLEKYGTVSIDSVQNSVEDEIYSQSEDLMTRGFEIMLTYDEDERLIDDSMVTKDIALEDEGNEESAENASNK